MRMLSKYACLAAIAAGITFNAAAQEGAVKISLVEADPQTASIRLEGANFASRGAQTHVYLSGHDQPLKMYRLTENDIRATVPARLDSGVYWVRVVRGAQPGESHEAPLTVGIVGPVVQDN